MSSIKAHMSKNKPTKMCSFRKYLYPPLRKVIGREGPMFLKGDMNQKLEFREGWGGGSNQHQNTLCRRGMDIFWSKTINILIVSCSTDSENTEILEIYEENTSSKVHGQQPFHRMWSRKLINEQTALFVLLIHFL